MGVLLNRLLFSFVAVGPLHRWRLNLNNNTLYILSFVLMLLDKGFFHMNVRLRMYIAIYGKGL